MANKEADLVLEVTILRDKLTQAEEKLNLVAGAVMESELRMYHAMYKMLKANDVNNDEAMRANILEIMNTTARDVIDFFYNKQLIPRGSKEMWPPPKPERIHVSNGQRR